MAYIKIVVVAHTQIRLQTLLSEKIPGDVANVTVLSKEELCVVEEVNPQMLITDSGAIISVDQIVWEEQCPADEAEEVFLLLLKAYLRYCKHSASYIAVVDCHV